MFILVLEALSKLEIKMYVGPKKKKNEVAMNYIIYYAIVGAIGGGLYYIAQSFNSGGMNGEILVRCVGAGLLGGLIPGAIRTSTNKHIPLFQSWTALAILIVMLPILGKYGFYWMSFTYGYIFHLLWEVFHRRLPRI